MTTDKDVRTQPPLSPAIQALLAQERVIAPQSHAVHQRALARAREVLHEAERTPWFHRFGPSRRLVLAAAAGVVLIAAAAAAYQHLSGPAPKPPIVTPVPSPHVSAPAPSVIDVTPRPAEAPPVTAAPPAQVSAPMTKPARRSQGHLATETRPEELHLLAQARQASNREDYASVLATVSEHQRRFPAGRLVEEREALRIKALVGLGRLAEARSVADEFRRRFPRSVLLGKIDDLLPATGELR